MKAYLMRVEWIIGDSGWIMFDKKNVLRRKPYETRANIVKRWNETYGKATTLVRFKGIHRQAEAAATIAHIQLQEP